MERWNLTSTKAIWYIVILLTVLRVNMMATPKAIDAEEWRWKVESAAGTLIEAEKIKKDKKLLKAARAELKKRQAATDAALAK